MLYWIVKGLCVPVFRLLFGLRVRGVEHVSRTGPLLLVANHVSFLDPAVVGTACPRPMHSMAKAELFGIPLLGWVLRKIKAFPVRRDEADRAAFRQALDLLAEGKVVLVFPEGTRGAEGRLLPGKAGAGMLALRSGAPAVPVYLSGTGTALGRGRRWPRLARLTVTFGPPLTFAGEDRGRAGYEAAVRRMMEAIARLQEGVTGQPARRDFPPAAIRRPA